MKINSLLQSFLKQKCQTFAGASLIQLSLMCLSLLFMMVSEDSLGFRLLVGQRKQFEDVTLSVFHIFLYLKRLDVHSSVAAVKAETFLFFLFKELFLLTFKHHLLHMQIVRHLVNKKPLAQISVYSTASVLQLQAQQQRYGPHHSFNNCSWSGVLTSHILSCFDIVSVSFLCLERMCCPPQ